MRPDGGGRGPRHRAALAWLWLGLVLRGWLFFTPPQFFLPHGKLSFNAATVRPMPSSCSCSGWSFKYLTTTLTAWIRGMPESGRQNCNSVGFCLVKSDHSLCALVSSSAPPTHPKHQPLSKSSLVGAPLLSENRTAAWQFFRTSLPVVSAEAETPAATSATARRIEVLTM
jgi:hypothetical protein